MLSSFSLPVMISPNCDEIGLAINTGTKPGSVFLTSLLPLENE